MDHKAWAKLAKAKSDAESIIYLLDRHREQCYRTDHLSHIESRLKELIREIEKP